MKRENIKDRSIVSLVVSMALFLALVLSAAYALIGVTTIYDDSNIVSTLGTRPIFVSDVSDQIALEVPFVPVEASEEYLLTNDTGVVNVSLSTNYEVSTRCTYDIVWQWDEVADEALQYKKTEGATKEYTISGSNGVDSFDEIQLNDYDASNLKTKLYTTSITAVKDIIAYQDWDITANFYKATAVQNSHQGAVYSGKIVIENVVCSNIGNAFAVYSEYDNSLIFYKNNDVVTEGEEYKGKVATAVYPNIELETYTYDSETQTPSTPWYEYANDIKTVSVANKIHPLSTANWFFRLENAENINLENLNTSKVTTMYRMFDGAGEKSEAFRLNLGSEFDTSNVTNMRAMFQYTGYKDPNFTLDLGNKFDTSNVTNMRAMFNNVGYSSTVFSLDLGDKFDTSNVTNMRTMFGLCGIYSPNFVLELGNKFDTSKVTDMYQMFKAVGCINSNFELNLGSKFDTSKVTNMQEMFRTCGYANLNFELDLSRFFIQSSCDLTNFAVNSARTIKVGMGWENATLVQGMFKYDTSTELVIYGSVPANIHAYDYAADNRLISIFE